MPLNLDEAAEFETKTMGSVYIQDEGDELKVYTKSGAVIGNVSYDLREGADPRGGDDVYLITNIFLDGPAQDREYVGQGIGRECMRILSQDYGYTVVASRDDGIRRDDGSHLTGDAPGFFQKMVSEGLVFWHD